MPNPPVFLQRHWKPLLGVVVLCAVACHPTLALASSAGGSLPWDGPLTTLKKGSPHDLYKTAR